MPCLLLPASLAPSIVTNRVNSTHTQSAADWCGLTKTDDVLSLNGLRLASGLRAGTRARVYAD